MSTEFRERIPPSLTVRKFADTDPIPVNLALCPPNFLALDANASILWPVLLKKVGVTISKGEHIENKPAWRPRNFGVEDLAHRLSMQQHREKSGPQDDLSPRQDLASRIGSMSGRRLHLRPERKQHVPAQRLHLSQGQALPVTVGCSQPNFTPETSSLRQRKVLPRDR
jgi:hypothetical protein